MYFVKKDTKDADPDKGQYPELVVTVPNSYREQKLLQDDRYEQLTHAKFKAAHGKAHGKDAWETLSLSVQNDTLIAERGVNSADPAVQAAAVEAVKAASK